MEDVFSPEAVARQRIEKKTWTSGRAEGSFSSVSMDHTIFSSKFVVPWFAVAVLSTDFLTVCGCDILCVPVCSILVFEADCSL